MGRCRFWVLYRVGFLGCLVSLFRYGFCRVVSRTGGGSNRISGIFFLIERVRVRRVITL